MKPRLYYMRGLWTCTGNGKAAMGRTPWNAYENWYWR